MSATVNTRTLGDVAVIDASGKIVLGEGASFLRNAIREASANGFWKILLNLSGVNYIDSAGVGELIAAYSSVTNRGGVVKLLGLTKQVRDVLQITKLSTVFDVHDNESEALKSFGRLS
jgi:anti-sigma B factor antagonist